MRPKRPISLVPAYRLAREDCKEETSTTLPSCLALFLEIHNSSEISAALRRKKWREEDRIPKTESALSNILTQSAGLETVDCPKNRFASHC